MTTLLTIVYAILFFSVIIFVHEFGHFIFAKMFDVYVIEFAIGMGPAIFKKQKGETLYSIRLIPMGGYCKLEGEDGESDNPRAFSEKTRLQRLVILSAGAIMNLILGFIVVFSLNFGFGGDSYATTTVAKVIENTPAYEAGIRPGDVVIALNESKVNIRPDFLVYNNKESLELDIKRGTEKLNFLVTPKSYILDKDGKILKEGTEKGSVKLIGIEFKSEEKTFFRALRYSFYESVLIGKSIILALRDLVVGRASVDSLSGPVGIVNEINTAAKVGIEYLLYLMALITINLGIFNLLPLPALDGGRILFIVIEIIIGKKVAPKYEGLIHGIGFLLLILLMLYTTGNDIFRIFIK